MAVDTITWLPPRTDKDVDWSWAVWETACGRYRIDYRSTSGTYLVSAAEKRVLSGSATERVWNEIAVPRMSLEEAMHAINDFHCVLHNLVLV